MKNRYITVLFCIALCFTACSDFLEENPNSSLTSAAYYKTEAQAFSNINSLYRTGAPMQIASANSAYLGSQATIDQMLTGYFTNSYEGQEAVCQYARLLTRQQNTRSVSSAMNGIWDNCYKSINIANGAIKYIPSISMDENTRKKLLGEAKFFRAFNYFYLVKHFGDVPKTTEPYESLKNLKIPREPAAQIYKLIEEDLKEAVDNLPAKKIAANDHRITKYAAAMMLSSVYMQENKYAEAATYAKIVVNSPHRLTSNTDLLLNSAFNKLRTTDNLDESIYALEYNNSISPSNWWPTYSMDASAVSVFSKYSIFERVYGPTNQFLNVYESQDLRIQPNQFFHWTYHNKTNNKTWHSDKAGCWYYFDEEALLTTGKGTKDWNFFRYAEALLNAAESIAQSNNVTAEAAGYLAQVKARANSTKTIAELTNELKVLSKQAFIEACWTERLREFPLEFKMWDDCLRTKKFPMISKTQKGVINYVDLIGANNGSDATFKTTDLLWPISIDEIQRNDQLTQNAGY